MTKPRALVVSGNKEKRKNLLKAMKKKKDINFTVETATKRERLTQHVLKSQALITTSLNPNSNEQKLARKLKNKETGCARILATDQKSLTDQYLFHPESSLIFNYLTYEGKEKTAAEEPVDWVKFKNWFRDNYPTFHDIAISGDGRTLEEEIEASIDYTRERRFMRQALRGGLSGQGKLGRQIAYDLKTEDSTEDVDIHSEWAKNDFARLIIPRMAFEGDQRRKFHYHKALEEIMRKDTDFLLICTGEYGIPYEQFDKIKNLTERLMKGSYPVVKPILQAIKDVGYEGIICMESNPTGPLLQVAKRMGIDPAQLSSITPDMSRHKTLLLEKLLVKDPTLQYSDIDLTVIGEHGKEIPDLRAAKVRGEPLMDFASEFKNHAYRRAFIDEAREIGLKGMKVSEELGDNYGGTPDKIVEHIRDFSHLQPTIPSAYSYFEDADCFIGAPSRIEYPLRITSFAETIEDLSEDQEVIGELKEHIAYQKALTDEYHPAA